MVQTSLIPTVITLSQFFANNFPDIFWYPNWYLGNPYQFLIGPIVPTAIAIVQSSNFKVQSYEIYLGFIFLSLLVGSVGIYLFLRNWGIGKRQSVLSAVLYSVIPVGIYLLNFQNGLNHIALSLLPFFLLFYRRLIKKETNLLLEIFLSIIIAIVLLINVSTLLPFIVGAISLIVAERRYSHNVVLERSDRISSRVTGDSIEASSLSRMTDTSLEDVIFKTILIFLLGISLATIWYTPRFWYVLLSNPSLGGIPLFNLFSSVFKLLLNLVPIVFAILVVKWRNFRPKGYLLFVTLFSSSFAFLTLLRFMFDPDFVTDWIGFGLELQFGGAIILGSLLGNLKTQKSNLSPRCEAGKTTAQNSRPKADQPLAEKFKITIQNSKFFLICASSIVLLTLFSGYLLKSLIDAFHTDYQKRILSMIQDNVKDGERVFLSGSSVFWINSQINVDQVRGGVDQGAINPFWAHGAYQIREGENSKLTKALLSIFGVSYILVHEKGSEEYYQDFKKPEKFKSLPVLKKEGDDVLYKVNNSSIGRIAKKEILSIKKPENGADGKAIYSYANNLIGSANAVFIKANMIDITAQTKKDQVISLAITYDKRWKIIEGEGSNFSDSIGNMVIIPGKEGYQNFKLQYKLLWHDWGIPVLASFIFILSILNCSKLFPIIKKRFPKVNIGMQEDEY
ncbi:MAG: hypothetical protein Q7K55_00375 [Candidatus Levybacteria bacterium]|nr:hypothetical protein [Candidatus Levybacteria bacterium]